MQVMEVRSDMKKLEAQELLGGLDGDGTVRLEQTGQRELAETMANHVFSHIDGDEVFAVVNEEGVADEVRSDHRGTGPGLDGAFLLGVVELVHLVEEGLLNEGTFFEGACHVSA
jgi:hypothetical protein